MAPTRSSARRTPRKKYTVDAFEGVEELQDAISSDEPPDDSADDDSSDENVSDIHVPSSESDDLEVSDLEALDQASESGEEDLTDEMSEVDDDGNPSRSSKKVVDPGEVRIRGLYNPNQQNRYGKERQLYFFGPDVWPTARKCLRRWKIDPCLPSRTTNERGQGGFGHSDAYKEAIEDAESNWRWYEEGGIREIFLQTQALQPVTAAQLAEHDRDLGLLTRDVLFGAVDDPALTTIPVNQAARLTGTITITPGSSAQRRTVHKRGFIVNLGARVQGLDWAPSQKGEDQYLAASVLPARGEMQASAFEPQPSYKSSIQIWRFKADWNNYMDTDVAPLLSIVLCTTFGDIKALKWCPAPCEASDRLGLLACIAGDGALRIFEIPMPTTRPVHFVAHQAAFKSKPPGTVFTCLAWIGANCIAAGCANGFVALYDLSRHSDDQAINSRPVLYVSIAMTFITHIASCWPSSPNLLLSTNMAGYVSLTDLADPFPASNTGTATSAPRQIGQPLVVWHDDIRCGLSAEDNYSVKALPVRRLFSGLKVANFTSHCTAIATSPCHPCVLYGLANGEVQASNPIKRGVGVRHGTRQLKWFMHEWRRPTEDELTRADTADEGVAGSESDHGANNPKSVGKHGLSRFVEGIKAEEVTLNYSVKDGVLFHTIYEDATAVTALAWSPNVHVGGWAAAGLGDGLLRVEDIGL